MTREEFNDIIGEMERLTMRVCTPAQREEYWQKFKDETTFNVQETIFGKPIKLKDFPILPEQFNEVVKILEEEFGKSMPQEVKNQLWEDYGHLPLEGFTNKITEILE